MRGPAHGHVSGVNVISNTPLGFGCVSVVSTQPKRVLTLREIDGSPRRCQRVGGRRFREKIVPIRRGRDLGLRALGAAAPPCKPEKGAQIRAASAPRALRVSISGRQRPQEARQDQRRWPLARGLGKDRLGPDAFGHGSGDGASSSRVHIGFAGLRAVAVPAAPRPGYRPGDAHRISGLGQRWRRGSTARKQCLQRHPACRARAGRPRTHPPESGPAARRSSAARIAGGDPALQHHPHRLPAGVERATRDRPPRRAAAGTSPRAVSTRAPASGHIGSG